MYLAFKIFKIQLHFQKLESFIVYFTEFCRASISSWPATTLHKSVQPVIHTLPYKYYALYKCFQGWSITLLLVSMSTFQDHHPQLGHSFWNWTEN